MKIVRKKSRQISPGQILRKYDKNLVDFLTLFSSQTSIWFHAGQARTTPSFSIHVDAEIVLNDVRKFNKKTPRLFVFCRSFHFFHSE